MSFKKAKVGFTLIELLVVIAIIGVLASIVLASLNSARQKSRDARRITDIKQIQLALELYYDAQTTPQYPDAVAPATGCDSASTGERNGLEDLDPTYIPSVPLDPNRTGTAQCYLYASYPTSGTITNYHLAAVLEDTAHTALNGDRDCTSAAAGCFTAAATAGFDGAAAGTYDVTP